MSSEIRVLSQIEGVRKNPWMYIGSVSGDGVHHLVQELVHNSLDEAQLGYATRIDVKAGIDFVEVADDGRGIPVAPHPTEGVSSCEVALTRLHAGSKFDKEAGMFTAGLHGVGLACVNALSARLEVEVRRDGRLYRQSYEKGIALAPLRQHGEAERTGTRIRFEPDTGIFRDFTQIDQGRCRELLRELSFLNPGLELSFEGDGHKPEVFRSDLGLRGLLLERTPPRRPLFELPASVRVKGEELEAEAHLLWTAEPGQSVHTYVNSVATIHGGTHLNALRAGITRALHRLLAERGTWQGAPLEVDEACEGLLAVLACKVSRPNFEGQTKSRLTNQNIIAALENAAAQQVLAHFQAHPREAGILAERLHETRKMRLNARRVAERIYLQHGKREIDEEVYKEQFGARSKNWHQSATWITHEELLKAHAAHYDGPKDGLALDVCCGSGVVGASFKHKIKKVIGLDLTPEMINLAKTRLDEVHQGNVYNIPFPAETFDLVCTREVLHLLPYPEKPVSEIFRVLKPGAQFVVGQILPFSEVDAPWLFRVFKKKQPLFYNLHQEEDFRRMLLSAGFVDLEMTEMNVSESIDTWIDSFETSAIHRHEIRELYKSAPTGVRAVHPFRIEPDGQINDLWRWCVFSVRKPT